MPKKIITQEELKALVDYDEATGLFTWKRRPEQLFATRMGAAVWNAKFPGKQLGCFTKHARGKTSIFGSVYYLSHLAWLYVYGEFPQHGLYHKNRDRSDNRICNLEPSCSERKAFKLTHDALLSILKYDPETGDFAFIENRKYLFLTKDKAGTIHPTGYRVLTIYGRQYKAHRVAWFYSCGKWPPHQIDHVNGDRADNRLCNLRLATQAENKQNRGFDRRNTSGYTGVTKRKNRNLWEASICVGSKRRYLGSYKSPEAAYSAYLNAKLQHHTFNPVPRHGSRQQ